MRILQRSVENVKLESEISMKKFFIKGGGPLFPPLFGAGTSSEKISTLYISKTIGDIHML